MSKKKQKRKKSTRPKRARGEKFVIFLKDIMDATKAHHREEEEEVEEDQEDVMLFFGRRATPGKCKTRLAKDLMRILMVNEEEEEEEEERRRKGETMAARLYEFCTERVLRGFFLGREEMIRKSKNVCAPAPRRRYRDGEMKKVLRLVFYVAEKEEVEKV